MTAHLLQMRAPIYQLDAFTSRRFSGNPAAVVLLEHYPEDSVLQAIAAENNQSETAFIVPHENDYRLRWFTPTMEVPLCGHATLASATVIFERQDTNAQVVRFHTGRGVLTVRRCDGGYAMDFPASPPLSTSVADELARALGTVPIEVQRTASMCVAVLSTEEEVRNLDPDIASISRLEYTGVIVTAKASEPHDIVSRFFAPKIGIPEDPVTGAVHCILAPYWAQRLGKTDLRAYQASERGGELRCVLKNGRVDLIGSCVFYLEGEIEV